MKKPVFAKPRPVYPKPQPSRPALRPPLQYKPVAFPNPTSDEDSYGTPIEQPAEPITKPPYQTTFTPEVIIFEFHWKSSQIILPQDEIAFNFKNYPIT